MLVVLISTRSTSSCTMGAARCFGRFALLATHLAAATAALVWMGIERIVIEKPTSVGIVTGSIAGLATITPGAGYVGPGGAVIIGALGGSACFLATVTLKQRFKVDDSLDVFAVHGIGGMLGSLLLGVFALQALGGAGLPQGANWGQQLMAQLAAVAATALWSAVATFAGATQRFRTTGQAKRGGSIIARGSKKNLKQFRSVHRARSVPLGLQNASLLLRKGEPRKLDCPQVIRCT